MKTTIILLVTLMAVASCKEKMTYLVEPDFEPYVQQFIAEGEQRGISIDFADTGLIIEYEDIASTGHCREFGDSISGNHHILINKSDCNYEL